VLRLKIKNQSRPRLLKRSQTTVKVTVSQFWIVSSRTTETWNFSPRVQRVLHSLGGAAVERQVDAGMLTARIWG